MRADFEGPSGSWPGLARSGVIRVGATAIEVRESKPGLVERYVPLLPSGADPAALALELIERSAVPAHSRPRGYRAQMMLTGAYRGERFGRPVLLERPDERTVRLVGPNVGYVAWTWYLKHATTLVAMQSSALHLKAACMSAADRAVLISGRGKTTLSIALSREGRMAHVSNTHTLVRGKDAIGVRSHVRIRDDAGQTRVAAGKLFPLQRDEATLAAIVYRNPSDGPLSARPIECASFRTFCRQFVSGLHAYDLEEEFFRDVFGSQMAPFAAALAEIDVRIDAMLDALPIYELRGDLMSPGGSALAAKAIEELIAL